MKWRRDPLQEHMRIWLAHWVQTDERVKPRCSGVVSGYGRAALPPAIRDGLVYVPPNVPLIAPTAETIARDEAIARMRRRVA